MKRLLVFVFVVALLGSCSDNTFVNKNVENIKGNEYDNNSQTKVISNKSKSNKIVNISVLDSSFEKANEKLMLAMLFDVSDLMNMTENEQINLLKRLHPNTSVYVREDYEENIIINTKKSLSGLSLTDLSAIWEKNFERMEETYLSNTGFRMEMLENKIEIIDGIYKCLVFRTKLNGETLNRYSSHYHLKLNNELYHIVTNTYSDERFSDLIDID